MAMYSISSVLTLCLFSFGLYIRDGHQAVVLPVSNGGDCMGQQRPLMKPLLTQSNQAWEVDEGVAVMDLQESLLSEVLLPVRQAPSSRSTAAFATASRLMESWQGQFFSAFEWDVWTAAALLVFTVWLPCAACSWARTREPSERDAAVGHGSVSSTEAAVHVVAGLLSSLQSAEGDEADALQAAGLDDVCADHICLLCQAQADGAPRSEGTLGQIGRLAPVSVGRGVRAALVADNAAEQLYAARLLLRLGPAPSLTCLAELVGLLSDCGAEPRLVVADASLAVLAMLGKHQAVRVSSALGTLLRSALGAVRLRAVEGVAQLGAAAAPHAEDLVSLLRDKYYESDGASLLAARKIGTAAARALENIAETCPALVSVSLRPALQSNDVTVRLLAVELLLGFGPAAVPCIPELAVLLDCDRGSEMPSLSEALETRRASLMDSLYAVVGPDQQLCSQPHEGQQLHIAYLLEEVGASSALNAQLTAELATAVLLEAGQVEPLSVAQSVREALAGGTAAQLRAAEVLGSLGPAVAAPAAADLAELLSDPQVDSSGARPAALAAARALARVGGTAHALPLCHGSQSLARQGAAMALGLAAEAGLQAAEAPGALDALALLLGDEDSEVRAAAAAAMCKVRPRDSALRCLAPLLSAAPRAPGPAALSSARRPPSPESPGWQARHGAASALCGMGRAAALGCLPALLALAGSEEEPPAVRRAAARALSQALPGSGEGDPSAAEDRAERERRKGPAEEAGVPGWRALSRAHAPRTGGA